MTERSSVTDPAAHLGVATTPKDPAELSARMAADAVRRVHDLDEVPADAPLTAHADAAVPGANYVETGAAGPTGSAVPRQRTAHEAHPGDGACHPRYWVGTAGEVLATDARTPVGATTASPALREARGRYGAAVEAVRLHARVPVGEELFAVPDAFVPGAFFVHDTAAEPLVRWVDADGGVHDGYRLTGGEPRWDAATVEARHAALAASPSTAALVG